MIDSQSIEAMFPQKIFDQVCGEHFNKAGHSQSDMLPIILEQVTPKNDDF